MRIALAIFLFVLVPAVHAAEEQPTSVESFQPGAPAALCQAPRRLPQVVCEAGGALICLNTLPAGSVKEDFVTLKGRLNRDGIPLGQFSVSIQNEYTKQLERVILTQAPLNQNCRRQTLTPQVNFCLEPEGTFAIRVPLPELGPYTVFVSVARIQGGPMQSTLRVSRVLPPTVTPDVLTLEKGSTHVKVVLGLLKGCAENGEICDFIGALTNGVVVRVVNEMEGPPHRTVTCETDTVQGEAGRFVVGVPLQPGQNRLRVTVCNAATGFDPAFCPALVPEPFVVGGVESKIEILSQQPLRFGISGFKPKSVCDDAVKVALNLGLAEPVCPDAQGVFEKKFAPREGYNILHIEASPENGQTLEESVAFASGRTLAAGGKLPKAVQLWLSKKMIQKTMQPLLNGYLASDNFRVTLVETLEEMGRGPAKKTALSKEAARVLETLPYCARAAASPLRIKVMGPPAIGRLTLGEWEWGADRLSIPVEARDVSIAIQMVKDENGDAVSDIDPLPLKIGFSRLDFEAVLDAAIPGIWRLTSQSTDCYYKREGACLKMPALLVPQHFKGNASSAGAFVVCDRSQGVSSKMDAICHALNVLDRQTGGVIQEKILDAINSAYACGGSAALTTAFAEGAAVRQKNEWFALEGKVGVDETRIRDSGVLISLHSRFGNSPLLVGDSPSTLLLSPEEEGFSMSVALPLISQIFGALTAPDGSPFGITIDEPFFTQRGFDFASMCDAEADEKKEKHPLCGVRPRAREILGPAISDAGYLQPTDPVALTLIPSAAFPLRVALLDDKGTIRLELADWELAIHSQKGPVLSAKLALQLTVQVSLPALTAENPNVYRVSGKVLQEQSKWWILEKAGSNTTLIPGSTLLYNLEQGLKLALNYLAQEGHELNFDVPRFVNLPVDSILSRLGLQELTWGPDGFNIGFDPATNRLLFQGTPVFKQ